MLRVRIHNLITDQRYEFQAADQGEIDAKLARKASVYGRAAWTEVVPEWWERDPDGDTQKDILHPEQTIDHPAEHAVEVIDMAPETLAAARAAAVAQVQARLDAHAQSWGYDSALSACSYAGSKKARFRAEAQAIMDWRDDTWAAVDANQNTVTSAEELLALLPAPPARPT